MMNLLTRKNTFAFLNRYYYFNIYLKFNLDTSVSYIYDILRNNISNMLK